MTVHKHLFQSEVHTWCPRCGTPQAIAAAELPAEQELECRRCHYEFEVDQRDLRKQTTIGRIPRRSTASV